MLGEGADLVSCTAVFSKFVGGRVWLGRRISFLRTTQRRTIQRRLPTGSVRVLQGEMFLKVSFPLLFYRRQEHVRTKRRQDNGRTKTTCRLQANGRKTATPDPPTLRSTLRPRPFYRPLRGGRWRRVLCYQSKGKTYSLCQGKVRGPLSRRAIWEKEGEGDRICPTRAHFP